MFSLKKITPVWDMLLPHEKAVWKIFAFVILINVAILCAIFYWITGIVSPAQEYRLFFQVLIYGNFALVFYIYIILAKSHWENNRIRFGYPDSFASYVLLDLIGKFSQPVLLFPAIILVVMLLVISTILDPSGGTLWALLILVLFIVCFLLFMSLSFKEKLKYDNEKELELMKEEFKQSFIEEDLAKYQKFIESLDDEWGMWDNFLTQEMKTRKILTEGDLKKLEEVNNNLEILNKALLMRKYADIHNNVFAYDFLVDLKQTERENKLIKVDTQPVLVNLDILDDPQSYYLFGRSKYYGPMNGKSVSG